MPIPRLYVDQPLHQNAEITLQDGQAHYITHVMRLREGQTCTLFNGRDGEWEAVLCVAAKKSAALQLNKQIRQQENAPDIRLLFAPIKSGRIDWLAEKATELGVSTLIPVKTHRTNVSRVNVERMRANVIEAAEQTQRLDIPDVMEYASLEKQLSSWDSSVPLMYGDESGAGKHPHTLLPDMALPLGLLIGPEGGFSDAEFSMLRALPYAHPISLGKRILRADTAALASITCIQLYCGDW